MVLCPDQAPNSSCRVHVLGDPEYQSNNHIRLSSKIKFCNFVCNFLMILLTNHSKEEVHLSYLILARSVGHKPESHSNCEFVQRCNPARQWAKLPVFRSVITSTVYLRVSWCPERKPQRDSLGDFHFGIRPRSPNLGKAVKSFRLKSEMTCHRQSMARPQSPKALQIKELWSYPTSWKPPRYLAQAISRLSPGTALHQTSEVGHYNYQGPTDDLSLGEAKWNWSSLPCK